MDKNLKRIYIDVFEEIISFNNEPVIRKYLALLNDEGLNNLVYKLDHLKLIIRDHRHRMEDKEYRRFLQD